MNRFFLLIFFFSTVISCNILQNNTTKEYKKQINKNQKIEWFFASGNIEFIKNKENIKLKTSVKLRKDSLIWLSTSLPIGIEMFRAQITKDSIYIIDKINHKKTIQPIGYLNESIGLDVSFVDICNILVGKQLNNDKNNLQFFYSEYSEHKKHVLPHKIQIQLKSNFSLTLTYNKIILNKPQKTPFTIPKNYVQNK